MMSSRGTVSQTRTLLLSNAILMSRPTSRLLDIACSTSALMFAGCLTLWACAPAVLRADEPIKLDEQAVDESAGGLACYRIKTTAATYWLEKSGAGLSSLVDQDGDDWIGFHPEAGSRAGGEFRGFPNAVHQQAGNYFHARNAGTEPSQARVVHADGERVTIEAVSENDLWACRYDFLPTHCTFTMTRKPEGYHYWVLYEGTPGGEFDDDDWWITSQHVTPTPVTTPHEGDIPAPEWIAFGDQKSSRVLVLVHHEDDTHPDRFYPMDQQMTVFGFGRQGINKFLDRVPQSFSLMFVEATDHASVVEAVCKIGPVTTIDD